jgi:hypothetical protein
VSDSIIIPLVGPDERDLACNKVRIAPKGYIVRIAPETRSEQQSRKFHAICRDIAKSGYLLDGEAYDEEDWKWFLVSAHAVETKVPSRLRLGIRRERVMLRRSTTKMSVAELSSLLECAIAWCAEKGIQLRDDHAA